MKPTKTNSRPRSRPTGRVIKITRELSDKVGAMRFAKPVTHIYNPLDYARASVETYVRRFVPADCKLLFLGMNPGPWGMAQTGVPFGEVGLVRDWMKIDARVEKPKKEHPKRPVLGLDCTRSEVSGARLWGWVRDRFGEPEAFFADHFVWNFCPLSFMEESGKNRTPDKLPAKERERLFAACDESLRRLCDVLKPERVVGVGRFARLRAELALGKSDSICEIPHPSPASPLANRGWAPLLEKRLEELSIRI